MALQTAVVGAGTVSDIHLSGIDWNPKTELVAVCDIDEEQARTAAGRYDIRPYYDVEEMVEQEELDWVHVCTSVQSHLPLARIAMEAGASVQIEKPITEDSEELEELEALAERHGVRVSSVHQHVFDPAMRRAMERVRAGELGSLRAVDLLYAGEPEPDEPLRGSWAFDLPGGEFEEGIPHPIYLALHAGGYPKRREDVQVTTGVVGEYETDFDYDTAMIQYVSEDGVPCSIEMLSGSSPQRLLNLHGEKKTLTVDFISQTVLDIGKNYNGSPTAKVRNNVGRAVDRLVGTARNVKLVAENRMNDDWETAKDVDSHYHQFHAEALAIENGTEMPVPLEEAKWTIALMEEVRAASNAPKKRSQIKSST